MRVIGNGGATTCHVDPFRIFPHGLWFLQAIAHKCKPKKPIKSMLHFPGTPFTREHGPKVKTDQDSCLTRGMNQGVICIEVDCDCDRDIYALRNYVRRFFV